MVLNSDKHMHLSKMVEFLHLIYNYLKSGIIYNSSIFIKMYVSKCMLVILLIYDFAIPTSIAGVITINPFTVFSNISRDCLISFKRMLYLTNSCIKTVFIDSI